MLNRLTLLVKPNILIPLRLSYQTSTTMQNSQDFFTLDEMVENLEKFEPLDLAESWDNVGLLTEPSKPRLIKSVLLVNDLTEKVLENAVKLSCELIISYHPPIFAPMKRIIQSNWKDRIVAKCLENQIAVYSPHTAWDVVDGGINDWLSSVVAGKDVKFESRPITSNLQNPNMGAGRIITLEQTKDLRSTIETIKAESQLKTVQIAIGCNQNLDSEIKTIALCGVSVLKGVKADLYITGEMSHHDVLNAVHQNVSVVLMNHSNSERGFFGLFRSKFSEKYCSDSSNPKQTSILLDEEHDKDPLTSY